MLTYLIKNNNFLSIRIKPTKKIRTNQKVFGIMVNQNKDKAKTLLQKVLISLPKRKKKISFILNTFILLKKAIILTSVFRKVTKSQIASVSLGNFHTSDCN